ncbi:MAG: sulfite exporter TauE/SafE family protein [Burkholderiales bacterium]|jgi:uncharacterized membrane protein YfcA
MTPAEFLTHELTEALGQAPGIAVLAAVAGAFVLGGVVKGLLGVGLPLVVVPLLALVIPTPKAIALMGIPILVSNVVQSMDGGHVRYALKRFAWLLVPLVAITALTVRLTLDLPVKQLNAFVACALLIAIGLMAWNPRLDIDARGERRWGVAVGVASGMMGGVSSLMGPLVITYLVALGLDRERFVGSISVIYLAGALPLFGSMAVLGVLGLPEAILSGLALAPMFGGMALGKRLRHRVSETAFRRLLLAFLTAVALILLLR